MHMRLRFGLIVLSMTFPCFLVADINLHSLPLDSTSNNNPNQDTDHDGDADEASLQITSNEQQPESKQYKSSDQQLYSAPEPLKYTPADLFAARQAKAKKEQLIVQTQKEEALSLQEFNALLRACMSHGKTKEDCLFEAYHEAVKQQENHGSFIIAKEILAAQNEAELEKEKARLQKEQSQQKSYYMQLAVGAVLVVGVACGVGGYWKGSHSGNQAKAEGEIITMPHIEQRLAHVVNAQLKEMFATLSTAAASQGKAELAGILQAFNGQVPAPGTSL